MNQNNKPKATFKAKGVSATIWENKSRDGFTTASVVLEKRYKTENGEWKSTNSLSVHDLAKARNVLEKAQEFLLTGDGQNATSVDE